jgi:hypothetical protein
MEHYEITYSSAGLLFPAISLLMLAYTNRFLGLAAVVRNLVAQYRNNHKLHIQQQVQNLRRRIMLLRHAQAIGVMSLTSCTACLLALVFANQMLAQVLFGLAVILMLLSLMVSLVEIYMSVQAITLELDHIDDDLD